MIQFRLSGVVSVAIALCALQTSYGQQSGSSLFGGSRTLGQGISGGSGGQGGGGASNTAGGGLSGAPGSQIDQFQSRDVGQATGNEQFVPGARQAGSFVGSDTGDVTNVRSQQGAAGLGGQGGGLQQLFTQFQNANQAQNNTNTNRRTLRAPVTIGFQVPGRSSTSVGENFEKYLPRLPAIRTSANVTVSMEGRVAVLRGTVGTAHERNLAEAMATLEPGISAVRNELVVATAD